MKTLLKHKITHKAIVKLEEFLGKPFHRIVAENFSLGMSRYSCTRTLNEITNWVDKKGNPYFKHATVWNAVKDGIKAGTIKGFDFKRHSSKNNVINPLNIEPRRKVVKTKPKKEKTKTVQQLRQIPATYFCEVCRKNHQAIITRSDPTLSITMLRMHKCPHCGQPASCSMTFEWNGHVVHKKVLIIEKMKREEFVNEQGERVENPFIEKAEIYE